MTLKIIFYSMGIVFAYFKHKYFLNIKEILLLSQKMKEEHALAKLEKNNNTEDNPKIVIKRKLSEITPGHKSLLINFVVSLLFFVWMLIGLMSFNWIYFAFVLLFGIWIINPLSKLFSNNMDIRVVLAKIYTIICWALCIFVIINTYYLNISSDYILNLFTNFIK